MWILCRFSRLDCHWITERIVWDDVWEERNSTAKVSAMGIHSEMTVPVDVSKVSRPDFNSFEIIPKR